ncbi:MAG: hypothetical protein H0A76_00900 [Candidatus Thiodubiliella endoseptemdiera]|uniref:Uncharacterized protein n=1 Tax=Candidatus Thiodubiliella endoseptemdiera TaxID=2738886 RepID=A0A853EZ12_9GAMM|nr:hypothetical protein [Candidatus Thiodubiliella endoseptemdiera]
MINLLRWFASYTDAQGTVETVTSAASSAVDNTNDVGAIAAISGTTTQGQTLTAGAITDADGTTGGSSVAATYQWTVSDTRMVLILLLVVNSFSIYINTKRS